VAGDVAGHTPVQVGGDVHRTLAIAAIDLRRTTVGAYAGNLAELDGVTLRGHDRNLADLIDPIARVRVEDNVDVPTRRALWTEGGDRAAGQAGPQHAGDLAGRQPEVGRL